MDAVPVKTCVRQGCGHREDEHTGGDGCTRQIPLSLLVCDCRAFVASRETLAASDGSTSASEANVRAEDASTTHERASDAPQRNVATRERLPDERPSVTKVYRLRYNHKDGSPDVMQFYFTASTFADGRVGEVFVKADKTGTLASGALDAVGVLISMLLQHGVPLDTVIGKLKGTRFPPASFTGDGDVPNCTSPLDLLARWLEYRFVGRE